MAAIQRKVLKVRMNISINPRLKEKAMRYASRYGISLSEIISKDLEEFVRIEDRRPKTHPDQGALI